MKLYRDQLRENIVQEIYDQLIVQFDNSKRHFSIYGNIRSELWDEKVYVLRASIIEKVEVLWN